MGTTIAILAHTERNDEIILEANSHILPTEHGFAANIGGLFTKTIQGNLGYMNPREIEEKIIINNTPKTGLICIENTHNHAGGTVLNLDQMSSIYDVAKANSIPIHLDGARVFNAATYLGVDVSKITKYVDSVMFCLSKGLSAPVGSVLCGSSEFISKARHYRKLLGGTMRQAGVIAAPGIIALEKMIDRLKEDHERAYLLARGLNKIEGIRIINPVQTNIIYIDVGGLKINGNKFKEEMDKYGIKTGGGKFTKLRMVTHRMISDEDVEYTIKSIKTMIEELN